MPAKYPGVYPPGRKPGIRRDTKSAIMDRCNSIRTAAYEPIPSKYWDEMAKTAWHKARLDRFPYTLDQDGAGSCGAEGAGSTFMDLCSRQGYEPVLVNPWFIYHTTSGGRDQGSVIGENVAFIRDHGIVPEEVWPRAKGWRATPSAEAKRIAKYFRIVGDNPDGSDAFFYLENRAEVVSALLQGYTLHGGYSGHSIAFCQYLGRGQIAYKNSWGTDWHDSGMPPGFGRLSLDRVYFAYGVYAYKTARRWTHDEWTPKLNQATLATAVNNFMRTMAARNRAWGDPHKAWREEKYELCLQGHAS